MASDYSIAYSDEFSIGLQAFNEALDAYQSDKGASFLYFAKMVINRRVIDYIRKKKFNQEYPFTYFEVADNEDYFTNLYEKHRSYIIALYLILSSDGCHQKLCNIFIERSDLI